MGKVCDMLSHISEGGEEVLEVAQIGQISWQEFSDPMWKAKY